MIDRMMGLRTMIVKLWVSEHRVLGVVGVFLLGSVLVPNNKALFVWAGVFILALFYLTRSTILTMVLASVPLSIIQVGQLYQLLVIPANELVHPFYADGRMIYFSFTPWWALSLAMIILLGLSLLVCRNSSRGLSWFVVGFLLLVLLSVETSARSEFFPNLSMIYNISDMGMVAWYWLLVIGSSVWYRKWRKRYWQSLNWLLGCVALTVLFQGLVTIVQYVIRSPLGLTIEQVGAVPIFGLGADENPLAFRPVGLEAHANMLANQIVGFLFVALLLMVWLGEQNRLSRLVRIGVVSSLWMGVVIIALSLSRAAYLALVMAGIILWIGWGKLIEQRAMAVVETLKKHKLLVAAGGGVLCLSVIDRTYRTIFSLTQTGGVFFRNQLLMITMEMVKQHPLEGVGRGMFIVAMHAIDPKGIVRYFPEAVHNGWLLLVAERGIVALVLVVAIQMLVVRQVLFGSLSNKVKSAMIAGFLAQGVMSVFHPFENVITFHMLIVMYLMTWNELVAKKK